MRTALIAALLLLATAKQLSHIATSYQTCCPDTYVLEPTELRCICPPERAFITADNRCVACAAPNFWDAKERVCKTCPTNSWWDETSKSCVGCPAGFVAVNKQCTCPATTPYLDSNNKCVACNWPSFWNAEQKVCNSCP